MATEDSLTAARLREVLHYDPLTGLFTWLVRTGPRAKVGCVAGCTRPDGYRDIQIAGRKHLSHRLAWLYVTGFFPDFEIDHENTVRSDNWWTNLRPATHSINMQNQRESHAGSTSSLLGVSFDTRRGRWAAQIQVGGKNKWLGYHETPESAHAAYIKEKRLIHPGCTI